MSKIRANVSAIYLMNKGQVWKKEGEALQVGYSSQQTELQHHLFYLYIQLKRHNVPTQKYENQFIPIHINK